MRSSGRSAMAIVLFLAMASGALGLEMGGGESVLAGKDSSVSGY